MSAHVSFPGSQKFEARSDGAPIIVPRPVTCKAPPPFGLHTLQRDCLSLPADECVSGWFSPAK